MLRDANNQDNVLYQKGSLTNMMMKNHYKSYYY